MNFASHWLHAPSVSSISGALFGPAKSGRASALAERRAHLEQKSLAADTTSQYY